MDEENGVLPGNESGDGVRVAAVDDLNVALDDDDPNQEALGNNIEDMPDGSEAEEGSDDKPGCKWLPRWSDYAQCLLTLWINAAVAGLLFGGFYQLDVRPYGRAWSTVLGIAMLMAAHIHCFVAVCYTHQPGESNSILSGSCYRACYGLYFFWFTLVILGLPLLASLVINGLFANFAFDLAQSATCWTSMILFCLQCYVSCFLLRIGKICCDGAEQELSDDNAENEDDRTDFKQFLLGLCVIAIAVFGILSSIISLVVWDIAFAPTPKIAWMAPAALLGLPPVIVKVTAKWRKRSICRSWQIQPV